MAKKFLAVFDFDHTIINDNSDLVIAKLLPNEILSSTELKQLRYEEDWTTYMGEIFALLSKEGVKRDELERICAEFQPTSGIIPLLTYLEPIADIIIISDSNSFIINTWLQSQNLEQIKIFTHPATWQDERLILQRYHLQTSCPNCPKNLCKGIILKNFQQENGPYDITFYIGDGHNDLCPAKTLKDCDSVFARSNYKLEKLLQENQLDARVFIWCNGQEIIEQLKNRFIEC